MRAAGKRGPSTDRAFGGDSFATRKRRWKARTVKSDRVGRDFASVICRRRARARWRSLRRARDVRRNLGRRSLLPTASRSPACTTPRDRRRRAPRHREAATDRARAIDRARRPSDKKARQPHTSPRNREGDVIAFHKRPKCWTRGAPCDQDVRPRAMRPRPIAEPGPFALTVAPGNESVAVILGESPSGE
jgi:hypothetical protein